MSEVEAVEMQGEVKWFNEEKGYGFIKHTDGGSLDIFVHANQLRKSKIDRPLLEGETVRFKVSNGSKGKFATDISIISDTEHAAKAERTSDNDATQQGG